MIFPWNRPKPFTHDPQDPKADQAMKCPRDPEPTSPFARLYPDCQNNPNLPRTGKIFRLSPLSSRPTTSSTLHPRLDDATETCLRARRPDLAVRSMPPPPRPEIRVHHASERRQYPNSRGRRGVLPKLVCVRVCVPKPSSPIPSHPMHESGTASHTQRPKLSHLPPRAHEVTSCCRVAQRFRPTGPDLDQSRTASQRPRSETRVSRAVAHTDRVGQCVVPRSRRWGSA